MYNFNLCMCIVYATLARRASASAKYSGIIRPDYAILIRAISCGNGTDSVLPIFPKGVFLCIALTYSLFDLFSDIFIFHRSPALHCCLLPLLIEDMLKDC